MWAPHRVGVQIAHVGVHTLEIFQGVQPASILAVIRSRRHRRPFRMEPVCVSSRHCRAIRPGPSLPQLLP